MDTKVLVIDDDEMIANSLKRILAYEGYQVQMAYNGKDGLTVNEIFNPDLIILDIVMDGVSGLDVCRSIKMKSAVPILFISARDEVSDRVLGLENGGDDYLVKPFAFEELIARIKALLRRVNPPKVEILQFEDLVLNTRNKTAYRNQRAIELSATEYRLLLYFLSNPQRVLSKEQILAEVWERNVFVEMNTIEVYIRYLRTKLEQNGEGRLIHTIRGIGYILGDRC